MGNRIGEPTSARELEVPAQLGHLDEAISRLGEAVTGLMKRLEPVSQLDAPTPTGRTDAKPDRNVCDVAGKIRALHYRVTMIREVVEEQVTKLEV